MTDKLKDDSLLEIIEHIKIVVLDKDSKIKKVVLSKRA